MNRIISFGFLYIFALLLNFAYSFDLNVKKKDIVFFPTIEENFLEKKEKVTINWEDVRNKQLDIKNDTVFVIELLEDHVFRRHDDMLLAFNRTRLNETMEYTIKYKPPKLRKEHYYSFLINIKGTNIYGLTKRLYYIGDLNKIMSKSSDDEYKNIFRIYYCGKNNDAMIYEDEVEKLKNLDDEDALFDQGGETLKYVIAAVIILIIIALILSVVAFHLYRKNKRTTENVREILNSKQERELLSGTLSQDFDIKSESAESEIVREKLKQDALEKERQKVYESLKEKKLLSPEASAIFGSGSSDVQSNAVSNTNTDFSWQGMEVMTFKKPKSNNGSVNGLSKLVLTPLTPMSAPKKINYDEIAIEVDDEIQHQEELSKKKEEEKPTESIEIDVKANEPEKEKEPEIVANPNATSVKFKL